MNEIQNVKRELNLRQWSDIIADRQASGKSIKQYCKEHHLRENTYYYWQKIIREQTIASVEENISSPLVKVNLNRDREKEMMVQKTAITLHLHDVSISVPGYVDSSTLTKVISAVRASLC